MLLTKYCRKTFPGMVSTLYLFGVTVPSGSVPSRITSRISNNFASAAGLAHAQSQSCCNDVKVSSESLSMIFSQRDVSKELLAHLHLHLRSWCLKFTYDMVLEGPEYGAGRKSYSLTPIVLFIVDFPSLRWTYRHWVVNTTRKWKMAMIEANGHRGKPTGQRV